MNHVFYNWKQHLIHDHPEWVVADFCTLPTPGCKRNPQIEDNHWSNKNPDFVIQESHKDSKFSTIRIGWNGSPTVLLCLRNPPKIHSTRLTIPSQPIFLKQCHGTSQGPEDRYHKQWSKVLKAKRSKFSVFLFASKKGSLWRMSFT